MALATDDSRSRKVESRKMGGEGGGCLGEKL